jgi:transposase
MLPNVQQATIKPVIRDVVAPGALVHTDEYEIYARLPAWGYRHQTVCHARGECARDEDGDSFCEIHVNTIEGFWSLLRSSAPRHLAEQAAALSRFLPVRAQRTPPRQSPARRPCCGSRDMTYITTPKPQ